MPSPIGTDLHRAMTLSFDRMEWMPSPPLAPGSDAIDVAHLQRMTLGEQDLEREVLAMFLQQSRTLIARLVQKPVDNAAIAHTLKGAAKAIGAFAVADAADDVELRLRADQNVEQAIASLCDAIDTAHIEIQGLLLKH